MLSIPLCCLARPELPAEWGKQRVSLGKYVVAFKIDWLDILAVQGPLKSLLQNHSSKASILQHATFFIVQLSHPYMTPGKTIVIYI